MLSFAELVFISGEFSKLNTLIGSKGGIMSVEFDDQVSDEYVLQLLMCVCIHVCVFVCVRVYMHAVDICYLF